MDMNERSIFAAALEIDDPVARSLYLSQVCGDQTERVVDRRADVPVGGRKKAANADAAT